MAENLETKAIKCPLAKPDCVLLSHYCTTEYYQKCAIYQDKIKKGGVLGEEY